MGDKKLRQRRAGFYDADEKADHGAGNAERFQKNGQYGKGFAEGHGKGKADAMEQSHGHIPFKMFWQLFVVFIHILFSLIGKRDRASVPPVRFDVILPARPDIYLFH